jgi:hypothetical protein
VYDSRPASPLAGGSSRFVQIAGLCGVPVNAVAVALNVTTTESTGGGSLFVGSGNANLPSEAAVSVSFQPGKTRANNGVVDLTTDGVGGTDLGIRALSQTSAGTLVHFIVDVNGYFQSGGPVLTAGGGSPTFNEGGPAVVVDPGITITDSFSANIVSAQVTITNPQDGAAEVLAATSCAGLTVTPGLNSVSITGTQPLATYQTCLQSVTYSDSATGPGTTPRNVAFTANDGIATSNTATTTVKVNAAPTDIALSNSTVQEQQPAGTAVGNFSTTDANVGDTFTYTLVAGVGSTDNASFQIVGNQLQTAAPLVLATQSSYSIRVRSTDSGGLFFEKVFVITLDNVNDAPTDIALSPSSVAENQPVGTTVGSFSTTDPDPGDTFTYTLVAGAGSTDNGSFTITGNQLQTTAVFDFETKSSYSIRVRSTDSGGLFFEKVFTVTVTDVNEAPTDIALSSSSVAENQPSGTVVGTFTTTDPDAGDTHTYTLVAGVGSTDNGSFTISGNQLQTAAVFDVETKSSYSIRVRSTDAGGLFFEKVFTITVTNVNEAPTDIALSPASVAENQPSGTTVGTFTTTDPDVGDTFTYTLVAGVGSTDNGSFTISGNQLQTAAVFDFETKSSYSIRVRSTDSGSLFFEKVFTITVTNVNEAPTDIALSPTSVAENQPSGTAVGTFTTTDQDAGDTHTYTLVAGVGSTDNGSFTISGNTLQTSAVFDFETKSSYSIRVRSTDSGSLFFEKVFTITVTNVNEAPTDIALSPSSVAENQPSGTAVGTFTTTDQDAGDTHTYTLVAGVGSTDNGSFTISGNTLQTSAVFDFETKSSYSIRVRSTDSGGLFFEKVFTITVNNVNEAPTDITISPSSVAENQPAGTTVGTCSTIDPDAADTFTCTLVPGAGSTDNASFTFAGNTLQTAAVFDFETKSSYSIRVRSTDSGGLFFEKVFTITVNNVNEAPTDIVLSPSAVDENQPVNTAVGTFSTTDPDVGDTHTYTLVGGAGSTDNGSFNISGSQLRTSAVFNFEVKSSYSIRVRTTDSGGLFFEKIFTITVNDLPEVPTAGNDTYDTIGNTELRVDRPAGTTPNIPVTSPGSPPNLGVLDNDTDEDTGQTNTLKVSGIVGCTDTSAPFGDGPACNTANGGTVLMQDDGSFSYFPKAADTATSDSFQYTVKDTTSLTSTGTVTINRKERVWYVKNDAPAGGQGRSNAPFNTLAAAQAPSNTNDYIFVYFGDGTSTGQTAGIALKGGQHLLGEHTGLDVPITGTFNGASNPTIHLVDAAPGNRPKIDNTAAGGNAVGITNVAGVEVRGLSITANASAINVTTSAAGTGGGTIIDNVITGSGQQGIKVVAGGTGGTTVTIQNNPVTATGNAIDVRTTAGATVLDIDGETVTSVGGNGIFIDGSGGGTTTIIGFANNAVSGNTLSSGIVVTAATFDATPGGTFQPIAAGSTVIGAAGVGNGVGASGMVLTNVSGDLGFTDLDIFADGGAGLRASGTTAYTGSAGFRIGFPSVITPVANVSANGGPAIDLSTVAMNNFIWQSINSSISTATTGAAFNSVTGTFSAGSGAITNSAGTGFQVGSSNATISYAGTINTTGGKGVDLTSNTGSTISFTGALTLSSGSNTAFNATGAGPAATSGGTVTATNTNNTLTTTTGTALNVANATIGASGLKFQRISAGTAASSPTNGILLNNTGASGGLTVTGTGSAGSGGTIQKATGPGISLTSTSSVSLSWMNVQNGTDDGINGSAVSGLTLSNMSVTGNGDSTVDEGIELVNTTGSVSLTNVTATGNAHNNIFVDNTSGTISSFTVSGSTFSNNSAANGNHGFLFQERGTSLLTSASISGSTFSSNKSIGLQVIAADTATISDFTVSSSTFTNNQIAIDFEKSQTSNVICKILNNTTITGQNSHAINLFTAAGAGTGGTFKARVTGNVIGNSGVAGSGSAIGNCIRVNMNGDSANTILLDSNTLRQCPNGRGIEMIGRNGTGGTDITVTNNDVNPQDTSGFPLAAILVQSNCVTVCNTVRSDVRGNTVPSGTATDLLTSFLELVETGASTLQLVDTPPASADCTAQLTSTNTGSSSSSAGCSLIAGPINTPP